MTVTIVAVMLPLVALCWGLITVLEQPASLVLKCLMFPEVSHFVIGVPRCCALSASCLCGRDEFAAIFN